MFLDEHKNDFFDVYSKECVLLVKVPVEDGEGGYKNEWIESVKFINYYAQDTSMEARRAEKEGVTSLYSAIVKADVPLSYGNYFKDLTTNHTFRITSEPDEKKAPPNATFPVKFFTAEKKELP